MGSRARSFQAPIGKHPLRYGSEEAGAGRYLKAKETKPEGKGGRESERPVVLRNQGNRPKGP